MKKKVVIQVDTNILLGGPLYEAAVVVVDGAEKVQEFHDGVEAAAHKKALDFIKSRADLELDS